MCELIGDMPHVLSLSLSLFDVCVCVCEGVCVCVCVWIERDIENELIGDIAHVRYYYMCVYTNTHRVSGVGFWVLSFIYFPHGAGVGDTSV